MLALSKPIITYIVLKSQRSRAAFGYLEILDFKIFNFVAF